MKNKTCLIISIIAFVLGGISCGIVSLFTMVGSFICGEPFYMINGSNGPIPACTSVINTDFVWILIASFILLVIGILFWILYRRKYKKFKEARK